VHCHFRSTGSVSRLSGFVVHLQIYLFDQFTAVIMATLNRSIVMMMIMTIITSGV